MLRSAVKRLARRAVIGAASRHAVGAAPGTVRVITYHRIMKTPVSDSCVSAAAFRVQVEFLARCCAVSSPSRLFAARGSSREGCAIAITIDDGDVSMLDVAAPALEELRLDAAFFIPTDAIGKRQQLTASEIRALSDAGFEIGSHSCSHRSMTSLSIRDCVREAERSRGVLEDITGRAVAMFAYPFGTKADFNAVTEQVLEKAGYRMAFTSLHAPLSGTTHALRIPRLKIERYDSLEMFERIVAGGGDAWRWVDEHLWWLQRGAHRRSAPSSWTEVL